MWFSRRYAMKTHVWNTVSSTSRRFCGLRGLRRPFVRLLRLFPLCVCHLGGDVVVKQLDPEDTVLAVGGVGPVPANEVLVEHLEELLEALVQLRRQLRRDARVPGLGAATPAGGHLDPRCVGVGVLCVRRCEEA